MAHALIIQACGLLASVLLSFITARLTVRRELRIRKAEWQHEQLQSLKGKSSKLLAILTGADALNRADLWAVGIALSSYIHTFGQDEIREISGQTMAAISGYRFTEALELAKQLDELIYAADQTTLRSRDRRLSSLTKKRSR